jgi:hypothetical protein
VLNPRIAGLSSAGQKDVTLDSNDVEMTVFRKNRTKMTQTKLEKLMNKK